jgi:uncharacterized RDD family membrane protein YckC
MKKYILIYSILMLTVGSIYPIFEVLGFAVGRDERDKLISPEIRNIILGVIGYFPNLPDYQSFLLPTFLGVDGYHQSIDGKDITPLKYAVIVALPYLITWLVLLIGIVNFKKSNNGKLLSVILMVSFFHVSLRPIYNLMTIFINIHELLYNNYGAEQTPIWKAILSILSGLIYSILVYKFIHFLNKNKQIKIDNSFYSETSIKRRIVGRLIDIVLIIFFAFRTSIYLQVILKLYFPELNLSYISNLQGFVLFNSFASFFYYLILESFFSQTPGKVLMGSKVFNREEEAPSFLAILGRTFCRFIPFEGIFFVLGYKLHDSISSTYVYDVEEVKSDN